MNVKYFAKTKTNPIGFATLSLLIAYLVTPHVVAMATDSVSPLVRAQKFYAAGDPSSALAILESTLHANPGDANAHYLRANCLVLLKRNAEAFNEYTLAERLAPKSAIATYSHTARLKLDLILRAAETGTANENADANGSPVSLPAPGKKLPPGTLELIRKQAELAKERATESGRNEAENEMAKASNQAKSLQERADRQAAEMAAGRSHGGSEPSVLTPSDQTEALRSQAAANGERLKQLGKLKAEMKEQEYQEKADEIQRQAEGLQDQLLHQHRSRNQEIELNPVGTNLYIRNYSSVPATVTPLRAKAGAIEHPPVKSTAATVSSTAATGGLKTNATGRGSLEKQAVKTVKGQLLPGQPKNGATK